VILHRFAEVYPGYPFIYDFPNRQIRMNPYDEPQMAGIVDYRIAKWEWWAFRDISYWMVQAYEILEDWEGWSELEGGRAKERVEKDLLVSMAEYVRGLEESFGNMSPRVWRDLIYAGRVLGRPEWIHDAVGRFEQMLEERFLYDGHWMETSPSYAAQVMGTFASIREVADGYSDPAGYVHEESGRRFDQLDLERLAPLYAMSRRSLSAPRLPDGRLIPLNDTWAGLSRRPLLEPRKRMEPVLMPGLGVAVLGGGEGEEQYHAWLNFTSGQHHKQRDALSLGFFAFNRELLPDLGYTHTRYRPWINATMSHNTVVVDGRESEFDADHTGHRLLEYVVDGRGFGLAAAESRTAYPGRATTYRRTLVALGDRGSEAYLLDLFEVAGGRQHDFLLHGSADADTFAGLTGVEMRPFEGTLMNEGVEFRLPEHGRDHPGSEAVYGFVRDLQWGLSDGRNAILEFRLEEEAHRGVRSVLATGPGDQLFLGRSPSIRRAEEVNQRLEDYSMPSLAWRRTGENLESLFVATHEALTRGPSRVASVDLKGEGNVLVISVSLNTGGVDYFFIAAGREPGRVRLPLGGREAVFAGRYGIIRVESDGTVGAGHLAGGTLLALGDWELSGAGVFGGRVHGVRSLSPGGEFVLEAGGGADVEAGGTLLVHFPDGTSRAYHVAELWHENGRLVVRTTEFPGFELREGYVQIQSFPQRRIEGSQLGFELSHAMHFRAE
jgi:hypothetical protein